MTKHVKKSKGGTIIVAIGLSLLFAQVALAHSGRTNAKGCHAGSKPYHCHNNSGSSQKSKVKRNEAYYNSLFCNVIGGRSEVRHSYEHPSGRSYVKVDCETSDTVYEGGLDKRSSLDSVHQALFFAYLTGKKPAVVIYDTDGKIGRFEYRIAQACKAAGVKFIRNLPRQ